MSIGNDHHGKLVIMTVLFELDGFHEELRVISTNYRQCFNTWQSAHMAVLLCSCPYIYGDAALLSSPCFLASPYIMEHALASPIYGHVESLTGYT